MRLANRGGRAVLLSRDTTRGLDLETASSGRFGPDPMLAIGSFEAVREFAAGVDFSAAGAVGTGDAGG